MYKPLDKYIDNDNLTIDKLNKTNSVSIHIRTNKYSEQAHEKNKRKT